MRKGKFFKFERLSFQIQVFEVQKKSKNETFGISISLKKLFFFPRMRVCARGGKFFFFRYNKKTKGKKSGYSETDLKNMFSEVRKKVKK